MRKNTQDPAYLLKTALSEHLPWRGARLTFLAHFLLALVKVRSVNLAELATAFGGRAKTDSHYKRLQRFFRSFDLDFDGLARLQVRLMPVGEGPWFLTLDRRQGRHQLPGVGHCPPGHRLAGVLERAGQGRQLQHG
jgi:hypothetical protein